MNQIEWSSCRFLKKSKKKLELIIYKKNKKHLNKLFKYSKKLKNSKDSWMFVLLSMLLGIKLYNFRSMDSYKA